MSLKKQKGENNRHEKTIGVRTKLAENDSLFIVLSYKNLSDRVMAESFLNFWEFQG